MPRSNKNKQYQYEIYKDGEAIGFYHTINEIREKTGFNGEMIKKLVEGQTDTIYSDRYKIKRIKYKKI